MSRPHSSTLVRMFEAPSHARCTPPSWATESSPYSTNTRAKLFGPRGAGGCARSPSSGAGTCRLEPAEAQQLGEEKPAKRLGRARVAGEERPLDDFRQVHEREHRAVEVGHIGREGGPLVTGELFRHPARS